MMFLLDCLYITVQFLPTHVPLRYCPPSQDHVWCDQNTLAERSEQSLQSLHSMIIVFTKDAKYNVLQLLTVGYAKIHHEAKLSCVFDIHHEAKLSCVCFAYSDSIAVEEQYYTPTETFCGHVFHPTFIQQLEITLSPTAKYTTGVV